MTPPPQTNEQERALEHHKPIAAVVEDVFQVVQRSISRHGDVAQQHLHHPQSRMTNDQQKVQIEAKGHPTRAAPLRRSVPTPRRFPARRQHTQPMKYGQQRRDGIPRQPRPRHHETRAQWSPSFAIMMPGGQSAAISPPNRRQIQRHRGRVL